MRAETSGLYVNIRSINRYQNDFEQVDAVYFVGNEGIERIASIYGAKGVKCHVLPTAAELLADDGADDGDDAPDAPEAPAPEAEAPAAKPKRPTRKA